MNIQKSAPRPDRVWSPKIEERPVGEPYFRSAKVDKSELEKLPVRFGNAKDSFDVTFTYEAPVIDRELAATVPNDHIPQHWIGPRPDRAERPIYMNHPVTEEGTGRLLFQKQQVRVQVPELTEGHLQASFRSGRLHPRTPGLSGARNPLITRSSKASKRRAGTTATFLTMSSER